MCRKHWKYFKKHDIINVHLSDMEIGIFLNVTY